jgi:hypothetical protein
MKRFVVEENTSRDGKTRTTWFLCIKGWFFASDAIRRGIVDGQHPIMFHIKNLNTASLALNTCKQLLL